MRDSEEDKEYLKQVAREFLKVFDNYDNAKELRLIAIGALILQTKELQEEVSKLRQSQGHRIQKGERIAAKNFSDEQLQRMKQLYDAGYPITEIAKEYKCSHMTIRRYLGLTKNGRGDKK